MSDIFDPYDEKEEFTASSLNDRMTVFRQEINEVPISSTARGGLGPNHIGSLLETATTASKILTPYDAVNKIKQNFGNDVFCDRVEKLWPGWLQTAFESGLICWQRISDSTGGSGAGTQFLTVDLGESLTLGSNKQNALLVMANIELCRLHYSSSNTNSSVHSALATIVVTESSAGVKTFHWRTMKVTQPNQSDARTESVDICHRAIVTETGNIRYVHVLAATIDETVTWGTLPGNDDNGDIVGKVRFCQLTAIALQAKVN
tara:strand:+ start:2509 stop:3291 length:783 start_codon:yes stop_codon:yes gene_type:complete